MKDKTQVQHGKGPLKLQGALNLKEIASVYRVSLKTLGKWLNPFKAEVGPKLGAAFTPKQVQLIRKRLGPPPKDY